MSIIKAKNLFTADHILAAEWHPAKNNKPFTDYTLGSGKKVWWQCQKGHEWEAIIGDRVGKGNGCPYCSGRLPIVGETDLATTHPELVSEWHPTKNVLTPQQVKSSSNSKVWWQCTKKHEWEANPNRRTGTQGSGCPYCSGRLSISGENDLATMNPLLASEWHPTKNNTLQPSEVKPLSNKKVWWLGKCGHEWESTISSRSLGTSCPVCVQQKIIPGINDVFTVAPNLRGEWKPHQLVDPTTLSASSNFKATWICPAGHEWVCSVVSRVKLGTECPDCKGHKIRKKVFLKDEYPGLREQYVKNQVLSFDELTVGLGKKVWWRCEKEHEWEALPGNRVKSSKDGGSECYYCSGRKLLKGFNDFETKYPDYVKYWDSKKNKINPNEIIYIQSKKFWWLCPKYNHSYQASISSVVFSKSVHNVCIYCEQKELLQGFNDLKTLAPRLAAEWHQTKNLHKANEVRANSEEKFWWQCEKGHEWQATIRNRLTNKTSCMRCLRGARASKNETYIADYLRQYFPHLEVNNISLLGSSELDIYIPEKKIAIEYNGLYWHSEAKRKDRNYHYNKWLHCREKGVQLIQIWEDDWLKDSDKVLTMLRAKLNIREGTTVFARKTKIVNVPLEEVKTFLNSNHIQGFTQGTYYKGLQSEEGNLVALLVAREETKNESKMLNILRYATSCNVPGGFTKLIANLEKITEVKEIYTFSDHSISDGGLYANNGFKPVKELNPDYTYLVKGERKHKFGYRLKRFRNDPELKYIEGYTESQLAHLNGLHRIWDSGKTKWVKENSYSA